MPNDNKAEFNELQTVLEMLLPAVDSFILKLGDDGWQSFVPIWRKIVDDTHDTTLISEKTILRAISSGETDYSTGAMLIDEYIRRVKRSKPMIKELELWIANKLEEVLDGKTAKEAFGLKKKRGTQSDLNKRFKVACYFQLLRNEKISRERAIFSCAEKWEVDPDTISRWLKGIKVPKVSNKTLESLSRIDLSPLL